MNEQIKQSILSGFIDRTTPSMPQYQPRLLVNDHRRGMKVLTSIQKELMSSTEFIFSVAFITNSGLSTIIQQLLHALEAGNRGTMITTDYLNFTDPRALARLLELTEQYPNLKVYISTQELFHSKGYIFKYNNHRKVIIGSSNLTQTALTETLEWNMLFTSLDHGSIVEQIDHEVQVAIDRSVPLTQEWLDSYEVIYKKSTLQRLYHEEAPIEVPLMHEERVDVSKPIYTNSMQSNALRALDKLRDSNENKALIVSATGTGKTYLAAFDVRNFRAKKLLFVVHREQIAKEAMRSFKHILGKTVSYGLYTGNTQNQSSDYLFATIQTISKSDHYEKFSRDYFDYIIMDEAHHSSAESYQRILNYFTPKFLLGMTATPERTEGFNVYELFGYNIAYEIRLQEALQERLLCPFHYYGISDIKVENEVLSDTSTFSMLVSEERVKHIVHQTKFYSYSGNRVKGLMFCSRVEEARELSFRLNEHGLRTVALSGANTQEERELAIYRLTKENNNPLDYILTVDIFNEGVDIPDINQVVLLRPTQSAIIFIQQLGRGLRKAPNKEYVVIIDFIGNYKNNFFIPMALSGDRSLNKDELKKYLISGNSTIPGSSTVNFEEVVAQRIFESIKRTNLSTRAFLKKEYSDLKYKLGRIPTIQDFYLHGSIDPQVIFRYRRNYHDFLLAIGEVTFALQDSEVKFLNLLSQHLSNGKRCDELLVLKHVILHGSSDVNQLLTEKHVSKESIHSAIRVLTLDFFNNLEKKSLGFVPYVYLQEDIIYPTETLLTILQNSYVKEFALDVIDYGLHVYEDDYKERMDDAFVLYEKYTRKDYCRLRQWNKDESATIFGYTVKQHSTPIFVTYHKEDHIADSTKYNDHFINHNTFSWMTRSRVRIDSKEVLLLQKYEELNMKIDLFIKKDDSEGTDFYYLGKVEPTHFTETTITIDKEANKVAPIVNIQFNMMEPVHEDIYDYLLK